MKKYLIPFICCALICCKAPKEYTVEDYTDKIIIFGTQGGFANNSLVFRIYENGQFEKYETKAKITTQFERLDDKVCAQLFNNFYDLGLDQMDFNEPGNLNTFIKMKDGDTEKKILWGSVDKPAPAIVEQYYRLLGQIAKQSKIIEQ